MKQTKKHSLFEALNAAAFAAPTALILHKTTIIIAGDCASADFDCNNLYVTITWFTFFLHSIAWKYVVRRVHERYGIKLDPINIAKTLYTKMTKLKYVKGIIWRSRHSTKN
jgi:hypothetical protein